MTHERYSKPKAVIEEKIARWTGMLEEGEKGAEGVSEAPPERERTFQRREQRTESPASSKSKTLFPIICALCKKESTVPFNPDPSKPVYCKDCLKKIKSERQKRPLADISQKASSRELRPNFPSPVKVAPPPAPRVPPHHKPDIQKTEPVITVSNDLPGLSLEEVLKKDATESMHRTKTHTNTSQQGSAIKPGQKIQFD